ncbi:Rz-like spanin [Enterobacteria phage PRDcochinilla]
MIKWVLSNLKSVAAIAVALLMLANFGYSILAAKKISGLQNEIKAIEEKATANAKAVETLQSVRASDAKAIAAIQEGQTIISGKLSRTISGLGRVSDETKQILDSPMPADVRGLFNNNPEN